MPQELSEQQKLYNAIEGLEMVLHPNIFDNLRFQVTRALDECRNEKLSAEEILLRPLIEEYKFSKNAPKEIRKMCLKALTEKIAELF